MGIRLIDPRGGFEAPSIYGPQIYDVAKLGHSIIGNYDLILADMFVLEKHDTQFYFNVFRDTDYDSIVKEFWNQFINKRIGKHEVLITTGLILLGIPIFHIENSDRAKAMYIQGLLLLNEGMELQS